MMKSTKPIENTVLYLNTEVNCSKRTNSGNTIVYEYSFNISPIVLNEYSVMKLISIAHSSSNHGTDHASKIIQFRVGGILYNPELYRSNDNGLPLIFSSSWTDNEPTYWNSNLGGLYLVPQTINRIVFVVSDDLTDANAGIDADLKWVLGLCIIPYDRSFSATEN